MRSLPRSVIRAGLLALVVSCSDSVAPNRLRPRDASRDIDISVGTAGIDLFFNGHSIGINAQGDKCFTLAIDGVTTAIPNICSPMDVPNIAPGVHTFVLKQQPFGVTLPGPLEDASPAVTATIIGGQRTAVALDLSQSRGLVTGTLQVNGATPPDGQYMACVTNYGCGTVSGTGGVFNLLVRPQSTTGYISAMISPNVHLVDFTCSVAAGQTASVGTVNVQFGTAAVDLLFNGQSIGMAAQGDKCLTLAIDGATNGIPNLCAPMDVANIAPGVHTFVLKQQPFGVILPGALEDASPVVIATIVAGQRTSVPLDLSQSRGMVTGTLQVNGAAPPPGQYMACVTNYGCSGTGGTFNLLVRPQSTSGYISGMSSPGVHAADFTFNVAAGQTTDVGAVNVQFGTAAIDMLFNGHSIGSSPQGDKCFTLAIDGVTNGIPSLCSPMDVPNIAPGVHTFVLKQQPFGVILPGALEDASPTVTATIVGGQRTAVPLNLSQSRGMVTGTLKVNGAAPPDGQYMVCVTNYGCSMISGTGGVFNMLVRPQSTSGYISGMIAPNVHLADFTFIVSAGQTTLVGGISTAAPGNTPAGTNVSINPGNQGSSSTNSTVTLTFSNVTSGGVTTVVQSTQGPPPPSGIRFGSPPVYFDLSTTAVFSGPITVCINYTGTTFQNTNNLKLMHRESSGQWVDVTTSRDLVNRIVCGSVTSLSPFIVGETDVVAAQPPTVDATVDGPLGAAGWYTGNVAITWIVNDHGSPITSSSGCATVTVSSNTAGTPYTCQVTSVGGTASKTVTITRDATPPNISGSATGSHGTNSWFVGDVSVSFTASDDVSGVSSTAGCDATQTTDTAHRTFNCAVTNGAGLTASATVTVMRDATRPVVSIAGNAGSYTVDQTLDITCTFFDATSGLASQTCNGASGAAYEAGVGSHAVSASAADRAGNTQSVSGTYTVNVTTGSLCTLVRRWVTVAGVANALCSKLDNTQAAMDRGNANAADNVLGAFINEVQAQAGTAIPSDKAPILIDLARALK
jgi:hypothetical protein